MIQKDKSNKKITFLGLWEANAINFEIPALFSFRLARKQSGNFKIGG